MELYLEHQTDKTKEIHFFNNFKEFETIVEQENIDLDDWSMWYPNDAEDLYTLLFDGFTIVVDELEDFYKLIEYYDEDDLLKVAMYLDCHAGNIDILTFDVDNIIDSINYFECDSLYEVAQELYDEGSYEEVPSWLEDKMDKVYELIQEDLEYNWHDIKIGLSTYFYECVDK